MKKKGKHKSMTGIRASLTPDYREKEESNNMSTAAMFWRCICKQHWSKLYISGMGEEMHYHLI